MFILSQILLKQINICNNNSVTTYSIAIGLIIYTSIYLYLLFYNDEYLSVFNKFIIYIIGIDLLLSAFYYINSDTNNESCNKTFTEDHVPLKESPENYTNDNSEDAEDTEEFESTEYTEDEDTENIEGTEDVEIEKFEDTEGIENIENIENIEGVDVEGTEGTENVKHEEVEAVEKIENTDQVKSVEKQNEYMETTYTNTESVLGQNENTIIKKKRGRKPKSIPLI